MNCKMKKRVEKISYMFELFEHWPEEDEGVIMDSLEIHQQYENGKSLKFISVPIENTEMTSRKNYPLFKIFIKGHKDQGDDSPSEE